MKFELVNVKALPQKPSFCKCLKIYLLAIQLMKLNLFSIYFNLLDRLISKFIQVESQANLCKPVEEAQASENCEEAHKPPMLLSISLLLL